MRTLLPCGLVKLQHLWVGKFSAIIAYHDREHMAVNITREGAVQPVKAIYDGLCIIPVPDKSKHKTAISQNCQVMLNVYPCPIQIKCNTSGKTLLHLVWKFNRG